MGNSVTFVQNIRRKMVQQKLLTVISNYVMLTEVKEGVSYVDGFGQIP